MATRATSVAAIGFGVESKVGERTFGKTMTYNKMKLLSVIATKVPAARLELGITATQKLSWEYGGWSEAMVKKAHEIIDKYASQLPPRSIAGKGGAYR